VGLVARAVPVDLPGAGRMTRATSGRAAALRRLAWHPMAIAGLFGALAIGGSLAVGPEFAWPSLGLVAGFATSGSV